MSKLPVWNDKYVDLGVTASELYMRQQGLCWLKLSKVEDKTTLLCTDGKEEAETSCMLNPTLECSKCMTLFILNQEDKSNGR